MCIVFYYISTKLLSVHSADGFSVKAYFISTGALFAFCRIYIYNFQIRRPPSTTPFPQSRPSGAYQDFELSKQFSYAKERDLARNTCRRSFYIYVDKSGR